MELREFHRMGQPLDYGETSEDPRLSDSTLISDVQQALANSGYCDIIRGFSVDGAFGRLTRQALNTFKADQALEEPNQLDIATAEKLLQFFVEDFQYSYPPIRYGKRDFISTIPLKAEQKALNPTDYKVLAKEFHLEVAAIRAIVEIESAGSGFLIREPSPARPKILFEAHVFYGETPKPVSRRRPDLSSRVWNKALYEGGSGEWQRLLAAMTFDPIPALRSVSWGLGQIMGFNHKRAGCETVEQLVVEAHRGEVAQLRHMLNFCKTDVDLSSALKIKNWGKFALHYNGPRYKENKYDTKLTASYAKWKRHLR